MAKKTGIICLVYEVKQMNPEHLRNWIPRLRPKVIRKTFSYTEGWGTKRGTLPPLDVRNLQDTEAIKDFVIDRYGEGTWDLRVMSAAKNSYRRKNVRFALVEVRASSHGYHASVQFTNRRGTQRASRFWFWQGGKSYGHRKGWH